MMVRIQIRSSGKIYEGRRIDGGMSLLQKRSRKDNQLNKCHVQNDFYHDGGSD